MSTRRSTRAASSRAESPPAAPTPQRRTARRAGNVQLPAVNLRASTAYGTNTTPLMSGRSGHEGNRQVNDVLHTLLAPKTKNDDKASTATGRSGRGRRSGPSRGDNLVEIDPNRTYGVEDSVFRNAGFDTSSIDQPSDFIHDEPQVEIPQPDPIFEDPHIHHRHQQQQSAQREERLQHLQNRWKFETPGAPYWVTDSINWTKELFSSFLNLAAFLLHKLSSKWTLGLLAALLFLLFVRASEAPEISYDFEDTEDSILSRFHRPTVEVPYWLKHPWNAAKIKISPDDVQELSTQILTTQNDVDALKKQNKLAHQTITKLRNSLPNYVAIRRDSNGHLQIPSDFWQAMKDLIISDPELHPNEEPEKSTGVTTKHSDKGSGKAFDDWLTSNRAKVTTWTNAELEKRFPSLMKDNIVVAKEEIIDMIRENWKDNQKAIQAEYTTITKNMDQQQRQINKLLQEGGQNKQQIKASVQKYLKELLPAAQLEAQSRANIKASANWGNTRVNHWSHKTGATIDINPTSKNYQFPSTKLNIFRRAYRYAIRNPPPIPNPPEAALTSWEEHGDCWCTHAGGLDGLGGSIAVTSGASIYPEQVVVEHIAPTASLQPGAAPREMELWAYIHDFDIYDTVKILSTQMFPPESRAVEAQQTLGYVRIATWTYDIESTENIQAFPVQLDLKAFSVHTNKLIIRAKNNWGEGKVEYTCLYRLRVHGEIGASPGF
ncbi:Sun domain-containing protein [Lachnellula hyalina]|uniref:Sun domain-containing protein n=1 Tax=Lachnellula hyalina TaxID=1316788 RepID=A0A8H8R2P1_9HELO|nr:Sun domain-containing protein [Lachnellula hyalina]TVY27314.1 Sun domain-containing protein [Lachnellula hyalina]